MQTVLRISKPLTPQAAILHDDKGYPEIRYHEYRWFTTALAVAKMGILRLWRSDTTPSHRTWLDDMHKIATSKGSSTRSMTKWRNVITNGALS